MDVEGGWRTGAVRGRGARGDRASRGWEPTSPWSKDRPPVPLKNTCEFDLTCNPTPCSVWKGVIKIMTKQERIREISLIKSKTVCQSAPNAFSVLLILVLYLSMALNCASLSHSSCFSYCHLLVISCFISLMLFARQIAL